MNFLQLKYFVCVAETGSLAKAAEQLYISTSGLSKAIGRLEEEIGISLFVHCPNRIELNPYGEQFLEFSQNVLEKQKIFFDEINKQTHSRHVISIGVSEARTVERALNKFSFKFPQITVSQSVLNSENARNALLHQTVDVVVSLFKLNHPSIDCKLVTQRETLVGISVHNPVLKTTSFPIPLHKLANETLFLPSFSEDLCNFILSQYKIARLQPTIYQTSKEDSDRLVRQNKGIAFYQRAMLQYFHSGTLRPVEGTSALLVDGMDDIIFIPVCEPSFLSNIYLSVRKDTAQNPLITKLCDCITDDLNDEEIQGCEQKTIKV